MMRWAGLGIGFEKLNLLIRKGAGPSLYARTSVQVLRTSSGQDDWDQP